MKQEIEIQVIGYQYDTTSEENTLMLIDDILNLWGRLDIWVAVALFPFHELILERGSSRPNNPQRHNATPKPKTYGSIIVVSSTASIYGGMWGPAYTMTQHAVLGLVKSAVVQLKGSGIRINCISSGTIDMGIELSKVPISRSLWKLIL